MSFWAKLLKPFMCLAPMEDVTDSVFRRVVASIGKPEVMYTEFVNVEGIINSPLTPLFVKERGTEGVSFGGNGIAQKLMFSEIERPIVAQIWGTQPEKFFQVAKVVGELGFDGVDINLGCPVKKVIKTGGCAAMIEKNAQVAEIIEATREGSKLPVSVKTRIGFKRIITEEWIGFLLEQKLVAIAIHGRTAVEKSDIPAHWDEIGKAVKLRGDKKTLIVGNGDINSLQEARHKAQEYGVDGVMIGRGIFKNPWLFADREGTQTERFELLKCHLKLWEETWGKKKHFAIMKKFVKMYVQSFARAGQMRTRLMEARNPGELLGWLAGGINTI